MSRMGNEVVDNEVTKFTWVIKNFSSLESECVYSDEFVSGGCKWSLLAYPKGLSEPDHFYLYLKVADYESLSPGWRRHARFNITIVNQNPKKSFKGNEKQKWFDQRTYLTCSQPFLPLSKLDSEDGGFLVNDEVKIVAEVEVLEDIGSLDVSEAATRPLKKTKPNVDGVVSTDLLETIDVDCFQVLPSQVESLRRIFGKHPAFASGFRAKNPILKATYMNVLLSLTEILRQLPEDISKADLACAYGLLTSLKDAGLKVDWLEKKVNEVSEKKEKEKACKIRMQEIQKEWKDLKVKVSAARAPLTLDDVV